MMKINENYFIQNDIMKFTIGLFNEKYYFVVILNKLYKEVDFKNLIDETNIFNNFDYILNILISNEEKTFIAKKIKEENNKLFTNNEFNIYFEKENNKYNLKSILPFFIEESNHIYLYDYLISNNENKYCKDIRIKNENGVTIIIKSF